MSSVDFTELLFKTVISFFLRKGNNYTEKCDVFSFAIIMWEIFTRQLPFHDCCDNAQQIQWAKYRGRRPQRINKIPDDLWKLMDKCWANSVTSRPSMTEVVEVLTLMKPCFPDADNEPLIFPEGQRLDLKLAPTMQFLD